jgi:hypothetical protein
MTRVETSSFALPIRCTSAASRREPRHPVRKGTKMRIVTTTLAAVALCAAAITPTMADQPVKYPKMYKFLTDTASNLFKGTGGAYFECNYTSKMCERGIAWRGERVFVMISDEDRTTVIGHGACHVNPNGSWVCWNFDTGIYVGVVNDSPQKGNMTVEDTYNWPLPSW